MAHDSNSVCDRCLKQQGQPCPRLVTEQHEAERPMPVDAEWAGRGGLDERPAA